MKYLKFLFVMKISVICFHSFSCQMFGIQTSTRELLKTSQQLNDTTLHDQ